MAKPNEAIDVAIIGGGVVGLSIACAAARRGYATCVLEREQRFGHGGSTHNSGVIHAGIYYPTDSMKAKLCVEGNERLYSFCQKHDIPHKRSGKLIVANSDNIADLETLATLGLANGVKNLELVDRAFIRNREPYVEAAAALWSPSTGIVEAESLIRTLVKEATARDVALLPSTPLEGSSDSVNELELRTKHETIMARSVVNAGGLYADEVSAAFGGDRFTIYPVRGDYAELTSSAEHLIRGLVYPLPAASGHGLGVHATRTAWGTVTLGPTARYQNQKNDYESNRDSLEHFQKAACRFLPSLTIDQLKPGGSGIRARCAPAHIAFSDFKIARDSQIPRLIHAAGIDSPGLTAAFAIAERIAELVDATLT